MMDAVLKLGGFSFYLVTISWAVACWFVGFVLLVDNQHFVFWLFSFVCGFYWWYFSIEKLEQR